MRSFDWLQSSQPGYCRKAGAPRGCRGERGAFRLPPNETSTWEKLSVACLRHCQACPQCIFVSMSVRWRACSYFSQCGLRSLRQDVPSFLTAIARPVATQPRLPRPPSVTVGFLSARHDRVAPATHALPAACHARDHAHNATVLAIQLPIPPRGRARMVFGTGFMMESLANALHQAACCAGVAILPNLRRPERRCTERMACHATLHALLGPRPQVCFDFRHLSRVAMSDALCSSRSQGGLHGEVFPFFWPATACPTPVFHGRLALRTLLWYANLDAALPCPPLHYEQTLVAHIRGGDVWMSSDAAPDYAQSPLAFYLASWRISGLPRLLVVSEDDASPLVKVATLLQRTLPAGGSIDVRTGGRWRDDLAVLRCARHLAVARSSIRQVLLSSSRVRSVYVAASSATGVGWEHPLEDAWLGSCKASVWLAEEELRGPGPQVRWAASVAQALESVLTGWNGTHRFRRVQTRCLGL